MKRIVLLIIVFVALLLPSTVFARIGLFPVTGIVYDGFGVTSGEKLSPGRFLVTTVGLSGTGKVECNGEPDCPSVLNGSTVSFKQDMRILIEFTSAGVKGRIRGDVMFPGSNITIPWKFSGQIEGQITQDEIEGGLPLDLNIRARLDDRPEWQGIMELELSGILARGDDITPPHWTSLGGTGTITVSGLKAEAGEE